MRIAKQFDFDAAHWLPKVAANHKCGRMHGHTYRVDVVCEGRVGADGMIIDYQRIADAWVDIHNAVDHRVLNEVPGLENPTTEILTPWIFMRLKASGMLPLHSVRVYESATTWCEVTAYDKA